MIPLYVGGRALTWAEAERVVAEAARSGPVEVRDGAGRVIATTAPPTGGDDPDWVKAITPEEIARRTAEPGFTFEEMKKRLGWE